MSDPIDLPNPFAQLAEVLSLMPDAYGKLLAIHVPDPVTGKCRGCTQGGTGIPATLWPCSMHKLATAARAYHVKRCGRVQLRGKPG